MTLKVKEIIVHKDYDQWAKPDFLQIYRENDIALLITEKPIEFGGSDGIRKIELPKEDQDFPEGFPLQVAGWKFADRAEGTLPDEAMQDTLVKSKNCRLSARMIAAGNGTKSPKVDDYGDILFTKNDDSQYEIVGILSSRTVWRTIFTRVSYFLDWVHAHAGDI